MRNMPLLAALLALTAWGQSLQVGAGRRDITPRESVPMWGYGDRHDALSDGVLDPLYADALVIQAGARRIAIVGLDLGRAPAEASLQRIRRRIQNKAGIDQSIIAGSHTHHGPVLELTDQPGKGKGRFDAALRYYGQMEDGIVAAILDANSHLAPARMAAGSEQLDGFNRNRHTKIGRRLVVVGVVRLAFLTAGTGTKRLDSELIHHVLVILGGGPVLCVDRALGRDNCDCRDKREHRGETLSIHSG